MKYKYFYSKHSLAPRLCELYRYIYTSPGSIPHGQGMFFQTDDISRYIVTSDKLLQVFTVHLHSFCMARQNGFTGVEEYYRLRVISKSYYSQTSLFFINIRNMIQYGWCVIFQAVRTIKLFSNKMDCF